MNIPPFIDLFPFDGYLLILFPIFTLINSTCLVVCAFSHLSVRVSLGFIPKSGLSGLPMCLSLLIKVPCQLNPFINTFPLVCVSGGSGVLASP